jgi:methyl-accepting chemotaxis protein
VTHLVGEIAAASTEQAQGIDQVNTAVGEMDRVVQQNAATAEESASSSEEMNAQAEQMKSMVKELVVYIEGGAASSIPLETLRESRRGNGKAHARQALEKQKTESRGQDPQVDASLEAFDDF